MKEFLLLLLKSEKEMEHSSADYQTKLTICLTDC